MNAISPTEIARRCRGATLIEVLVSILLLSLALLGIAGLMSATIGYQIGVESRSIISLLFSDVTNRLRSNLPQLPGYDSSAYVYTASWASQQSAISAPGTNCGPLAAATCTSTERAAYDLWEIRSATRRALPQGSWQMSGNTMDGLTVSYLWFDKEFTEHLTASSPLSLRTSIRCSTASPEQQQTCCPDAAQVNSTPGVRCLNFSFIP